MNSHQARGEAEPRERSLNELRALDGIKWSRYEAPVIAAWVADMDLAPPAFVAEALSGFAAGGDYGYNFAAVRQLPAVFSDWQRKHHGWTPDETRVRTFCDVLHAIDVALWLHTDPGDGIVLLTPVYPPFITAVKSVGRRIIDVPLQPADGWRLDAERLESAIDERTRVLLLCHPHNPTGRVFDAAERAAIARIVVEHDLLLISDEVWADLTHPGAAHRPMALEAGLTGRTLTVSSASKAFNLAGLRCAVAHVDHAGLAQQLEELPGHFLGAVSTPGAVASLTAWTEGEAWLDRTRAYLTARRDQLVDRLAVEAPEIGLSIPEATYLAWLDLRRFDLQPEPARHLLDTAALALNPGTDFGPDGAGYVRLNFATSAAILDEIIDRLVHSLA